MIATADPAPLRRIRLHRRRGGNEYQRKERFAALCEEHSVALITISQDNTASWTVEKDRRRCTLIDKSLHSDLTANEQQELSQLQTEAETYFDEVAPPPIDGALKIHADLQKLASKTDE